MLLVLLFIMPQTHPGLYINRNKYVLTFIKCSNLSTKILYKVSIKTKPNKLTNTEFDLEIQNAEVSNQKINIIIRKK